MAMTQQQQQNQLQRKSTKELCLSSIHHENVSVCHCRHRGHRRTLRWLLRLDNRMEKETCTVNCIHISAFICMLIYWQLSLLSFWNECGANMFRLTWSRWLIQQQQQQQCYWNTTKRIYRTVALLRSVLRKWLVVLCCGRTSFRHFITKILLIIMPLHSVQFCASLLLTMFNMWI